ncbi:MULTISPECIES: ABC transporter substrate-binding protein [unclassified Paenibacillus]|uniref:ABC transporter substrate-binding protein n=1 Tax=unclassified Paenibacillus TaxID=185978 RepID=UPI0027844FC9|nr:MULTISPECIES: ABC transporter substrate-binding protein [unclassified Paenibacillus]MDQ0900942.1 ABC-type sugar transport system substrate-binding protein [Paenibacillus sp. V4I7]MDQ0920558.1 ABC-type sugar transport system substrate-binding protein [Paenibacillus sp. V4I5]
MHLRKPGLSLVLLSKLIIVICFLVLPTGCDLIKETTANSRNGEEGKQVPGLKETNIQKRPILLGFSQLGSESDWRKANTLSIKESAEESEISLLFENAEQSQERQFEAVRSFIKQKVDVISIAPVVEKGWEPILKEVKQAGIPVIIIDRLVEVSDPSLYVTFIGSDFYEEGRKAGKYVLDKLANIPSPIGIVELKGTEGSTPSIARGKGFHEVITKNTDFAVLESANADFTVTQGKEVMRSFLQARGTSIRVLFSHNDDMALGAIEAIEEYGLRPGKDIVIVSVDGTRKALEKLMEGKINSVVECNPLLGPNLIQAVNEMIDGRTLPKRIVTPESIFTEVTAAREIGTRRY